MFGATKMYPIFLDNLGFHGTFWLYGSVMAAVVVYGGIVIQENKGEHMVKVKTVKKINLKSYVYKSMNSFPTTSCYRLTYEYH